MVSGELSAVEVAELLACSAQTVRTYCKVGYTCEDRKVVLGSSVVNGKRELRISYDELLMFVRATKVADHDAVKARLAVRAAPAAAAPAAVGSGADANVQRGDDQGVFELAFERSVRVQAEADLKVAEADLRIEQLRRAQLEEDVARLVAEVSRLKRSLRTHLTAAADLLADDENS